MVPTGSGELAKFDEGAQLAQTISAAAWAPAKVAPVMAASWSLRPQLSPAHGQASCCFRDNLTTQEDPSVSHLHLSDLSSLYRDSVPQTYPVSSPVGSCPALKGHAHAHPAGSLTLPPHHDDFLCACRAPSWQCAQGKTSALPPVNSAPGSPRPLPTPVTPGGWGD